VRDTVDRRLIEQVITRTGRIIDSPDEVGGWPKYASAQAPLDRDRDGLPDAWETAHNLNPNDPKDSTRDSGDGYTHIEKYINALAEAAIAKIRAAAHVPGK
jgi:hypothetical protein